MDKGIDEQEEQEIKGVEEEIVVKEIVFRVELFESRDKTL